MRGEGAQEGEDEGGAEGRHGRERMEEGAARGCMREVRGAQERVGPRREHEGGCRKG